MVTPNPKTSGGGALELPRGLGLGAQKQSAATAKAQEYVRTLYKNVPVLDSGARGSTITFAQRGIGQVLIAWENEAHSWSTRWGSDKFEIVFPSVSILAEPPVAVVDKNVDKHGTRAVAEAYLQFLYTRRGRSIAAQAPLPAARRRPSPSATRRSSRRSSCSPSTSAFGGWQKAQATHFADGGIFDQIYQPGS